MLSRIILAVWDVKAQAYTGDPIFAITRGTGERSFADACNDSASVLNKYPDDFELHELGSFDVMTGRIEPLEPRPTVYGKARSFIRES